jgi:hypothetical protein
MGWELFAWILAAGLFGMLFFLYLSIGQEEKHWRPVAQSMRQHGRNHRRDSTLANT